ncbi:MAG: rhomboid family intramembrane serine protease [Deltaproteobacteria bacterium]|nr:rhomboid family intramembrane serine protease [Deltaproteobacteria bacterium]MBW2256449.1 rhomboid family intramembrane serine protease [Deltaproteobacteria bacterium]
MPRSRRGTPVAQSTARLLWGLVGANVLVYVAWQMAIRQGEESLWVGVMADHFLVSLEAMFAGRVWTLLTSAFSHIDPFHLFVNMLALWVFGRDVYRVTGSRGFLHLYVVGALLASIGHVAYSLLSGSPNPALGASGSVMAIAVVFAALYPRRILLVNFFIPVPAALAVAAYVVLDALGVFGGTTDNVAHAAHLGGAAYGLLYWLIVLRRKRLPRQRRG